MEEGATPPGPERVGPACPSPVPCKESHRREKPWKACLLIQSPNAAETRGLHSTLEGPQGPLEPLSPWRDLLILRAPWKAQGFTTKTPPSHSPLGAMSTSEDSRASLAPSEVTDPQQNMYFLPPPRSHW